MRFKNGTTKRFYLAEGNGSHTRAFKAETKPANAGKKIKNIHGVL